MSESNVLHVRVGDCEVGTLAEMKDHRVASAYSDEWLASGYSLNPFSLPLKKEVFVPRDYMTFAGLFGVFADSLPDGCGEAVLSNVFQCICT